ncbi:MAG: hypothetical protein KJ720_00910 [Proteobacteria bacterium]|nr:hypothetical protein [Pseudomonadota bacterium]MBU1451645.1 hypothetical protein [Pseudomonadota bacterium]MBU2470230.1 hypothetical protein [Pseudomonadota bacterium]MBU2518197.1 hypothetical protein [Pseudomonadota bacterium]
MLFIPQGETTAFRGLRPWLGKAALALLWALTLRLLAQRLGLPDSPAGELAPLIGLDRPGFWWKFMGDWAPLGLLLMSSAGHLLARWAGPEAPTRAAKLAKFDWLAYLALPLILAFTAMHSQTPAWPLMCGAAYLAALTWQAVLAASVLWEAGGRPSPNHHLLVWGSAGLGLALYLALNFWVTQAVSTCGDETLYLINTDRLMAAIGLSSGQAHLPQCRLEFYWGGWSSRLARPLGESWAFFALLGPGWLAAGRLGALAMLALAGAASLGLFCRLALELGYRARPVLAAGWLLGFSLPLLQLTQHVYPGALGVLGVTAGLYWLHRLERRTGLILLGIAGLALTLALVKMRLAPVSLGLSLAALTALYVAHPAWRRRVLAAGAALAGLCLALLLAVWLRVPAFEALTLKMGNFYRIEPGPILLSLPAMFFDQQFGLLAYAPWLLLGLAGAARFGRAQPRLMLYSLITAGVALLAVVLWRWVQWQGGFTPPGRFLAPLLPVLALWSLPAWSRAGHLWRLLSASLGLASLSLAWVFTLIPQWRFHRRTGINNLLAWLDQATGSVTHRFWPSFNEVSWQPILPALPWLALLIAGGIYLWRDPRSAEPGPAWGLGRLGLTAGALVAALIAVTVSLGWIVPTGYIEAENLRTPHSRLYGDLYNARVQLVLRGPADFGQTMVVVGSGTTALEVKAVRVRGLAEEGTAPEIAFYLDEHPLGRILVEDTAWRTYRLPVKIASGRYRLKVVMLKHNGRDAVGLDLLRLR